MKDYTDLSTAELISLLEGRSLPTDGDKDSLISRLEAYDAVHNPSPSPELHLSPALPDAQIHGPVPSSIPNHLPNELDEEYCLNWDDADDDDGDDAAKTTTIAETAEATKVTEAAEPDSLKVAEDSSTQPKSDPIAAPVEDHSSQPSVHPVVSPTSVEKVTKSGYKYKSIAATFFPDLPKPSATTLYGSPVKAPATAFLKPLSTTCAALTKNFTDSPSDASPTALSKALSKPPSIIPSNVLSEAPASPADNGSDFVAPPVTATASFSAASKSPVLSNDGGTVAAAAAKGKSTPKATINASRVKTTKSGYKFNSIASLFTSSPKSVTAAPPKPTTTSTKPQKIANVVIDADSTYSRDVELTPEEEEAKKLAIRATRFGITTKEAEALAALNERKHGQSAQSKAADEKNARESERKAEIEKEREREKIRQRVTSTKRQRNDDDDDRRPEYQHRYNRQSQYRSPHTKANYNSRRRH